MEANNEPPTTFSDGSHLVMVPGHPNVSEKILFCPRFGGLFVCVLGCACTLKKCHGPRDHLRDHHSAMCTLPDNSALLPGSRALTKQCDELLKNNTVPIDENDRRPVPFLQIRDGFKCNVSGCRFATSSYGVLRTHHRDVHNKSFVSNDSLLELLGEDCRIQLLKNNTTVGIVIDDGSVGDENEENENNGGSPNTTTNNNNNSNQPSNNNYGGFGTVEEFSESFPKPEDDLPETDFRRRMILEVITQWREVILDEQVEVVKRVLVSNQLFGNVLAGNMRKMARLFIQKSRAVLNSPTFPQVFKATAAEESQSGRTVFTTVRTDSSSYLAAINKLIRWFLVAANLVTLENGPTQTEPDQDSNADIDAQPQWLLLLDEEDVWEGEVDDGVVQPRGGVQALIL